MGREKKTRCVCVYGGMYVLFGCCTIAEVEVTSLSPVAALHLFIGELPHFIHLKLGRAASLLRRSDRSDICSCSAFIRHNWDQIASFNSASRRVKDPVVPNDSRIYSFFLFTTSYKIMAWIKSLISSGVICCWKWVSTISEQTLFFFLPNRVSAERFEEQ